MTDPLIAALQPLLHRVRTDASCVKKADGTQAWTREPITEARLAKHLNGGPARGVAFIQPGQGVTLVGLLDLDSHDGETPWSGMVEAARAVVEVLELLGMRPVVWRSSGGRGIHVYLLWDAPQDAYSVRVFLIEVLAACGYRNGTRGVQAGEMEVFPKQDSVAPEGFGNQVILPLAGQSVPLIDFEPAGRDAAAIEWPVSPAVTVVARPQRSLAAPASIERATLRAALAAIPNEGLHERSYDQWRDIVFAVHQATGGDGEGLQLAHEFSARSSKYAPTFLDARVWPYVRDREGGITARSIMATAREHGWVEPVEDDFEVVNVPVLPGAAPAALPPFKRNKAGQIEATIGNLLMALRRPDVCRVRIGHDRFNDELMLAQADTTQWRLFTDEDYTRLRDGLARGGFCEVGRELMRDAVGLVAHENAFDSAQVWLRGLAAHDGVARCGGFLHQQLGAEDTPYARAVSLYLWSALAGRVLEPGCQADMALALLGAQSIGKTSAVKALVPDEQQFVEINLAHRDDNLARSLRGKIVGELGELRGLAGREAEDIKAWISRRHEEWVPKYKEFATKFPRRLVFIGTTNADEFLVDTTGNRRWLPVRVGVAGRVDVPAIERDRDQLWAEARDLFLSSGVAWKEAETLAAPVHAEHMVGDSWADAVSRWLDEPAMDGISPRERKFLRVGEVLQEALGVSAREAGRREELRMGNVLRTLGYERAKVRVDERAVWAYRVPLVPLCEKGRGTG